MDEVILSRITKEAYEKGYADGKVDGYNLAGKAISPERKKGKWEYIGGYGYQFRCSECVMCVEHKTKYCPNCGADMRGENDAEG